MRNRAYTLLEMMVAVALSSILMITIIQAYLSLKVTYQAQQSVLEMTRSVQFLFYYFRKLVSDSVDYSIDQGFIQKSRHVFLSVNDTHRKTMKKEVIYGLYGRYDLGRRQELLSHITKLTITKDNKKLLFHTVLQYGLLQREVEYHFQLKVNENEREG